ncbi:MAG: C39 family peptidase [Candidatus Andersenbacteria bacterium]
MKAVFIFLAFSVVAGIAAAGVAITQELRQSSVTEQPITETTILPTVTPTASPTPTPTPTFTPLTLINHSVPFVSQAPEQQWSNPVFQDACEEASILMAAHWLQGGTPITPPAATQSILDIVEFEKELIGEWRDTSAQDSARLMREYYKTENVEVVENITVAGIKEEIYGGNIVIMPTNGRLLGNPNFNAPGPEYHMIVIKGYDPATREFITNDPGTRLGADYRYTEDTIFNAIRNYNTGYHLGATPVPKTVIVVSR